MTRIRVASLSGLVLLAVTTLVPAQPPGAASPPPDKSLESIPREGFIVLSVKVADLWDHPILKPAREWVARQKEGPLESLFGVGPADLDRVTILIPAFRFDGPPFMVVVITTRKPYNEARVLKHLGAGTPGEGRFPGGGLGEGVKRSGNVVQLASGEFNTLILADDRTLILLDNRHREGGGTGSAALIGQLLTRKAAGPLTLALKEAESHTLAVGIDVQQFAASLVRDGEREWIPYTALLAAKSATLTGDLVDKGVKARLALTFGDAAAARRAGPVLEEGLADLARQLEMGVKQQAERQGENAVLDRVMLVWLGDFLKGSKVEVKGDIVTASTDVPVEESLGKLVAALPKSIFDAHSNSKASNNLKQLVLALLNYESVYGLLPSDVGPDGKTVWSWRVQILPFIEQVNLYNRLDLNLSWDDPRNKAILENAAMPSQFEIPGHPAPKGQTYWRSFSRPKNSKELNVRPWLVEGERGPRMIDITDGTSNTFAIVEAGESVPWYAPDVLAYDGKLPLPPLGAKGAARFLAGFGDGSVRVISTKTDEMTLRGLITINGGEVFKLPDW